MALYFLSIVKPKKEEKREKDQYWRLLDKVSRKIDKWYEETQMEKNQESFKRDEEFVELDHSPTHFDSLSSREDEEKEEGIGDETISSGVSAVVKRRNRHLPENPLNFRISLKRAAT